MANDLLGVGVTGLRVSQSALRTVGHNIANAGTDGYSRQRTEVVTNPALLQGGHYVGGGAHVNSVERIVNGFVTDQLRVDSTLFSDLDGFHSQLTQLDNLLANESTGLSGSLNSFFAAMQNGTDDPTSISARELIISEAENVSDRFNSIYGRLQVIDRGVDDAMGVAVAQINALTSNIAQLNLKISDALATGNGASPNDLLDQRDEALKNLAGLVPIQVFEVGSGQVNVAVGSGQALVVGQEARKLSLESSADDGSKLDVMFNSNSRKEAVTSLIKGGELGGLIRFRDDIMGSAYNELGHVAVVMADSFNQVHQQGINLLNEFGGLFFDDINEVSVAESRVVANARNAGPDDRDMALYIRDSAQITASDYHVALEGGGLYRITRVDDGQEVATGLMPGRLPFSISFDGMELAFEQGSFQKGDEFLLQPVRTGAADFKAAIDSANSLALATPLLTDASLGNRGSGTISAGEILALQDQNGEPLPLLANSGEMAPPLVVVFNTPSSYDILDNSDPGNPVHLSPPIRNQRYTAGMSTSLFQTDPGATMATSQGEMIGLPDGRGAVVQPGPNETTNGYPAEILTITRSSGVPGEQPATTNLFTGLNATAKQTASQLSNVSGVEANAFNYLELSDLGVTGAAPLQIELNGENLLQYDVDPVTGTPVLSPQVPDPATDPQAFYDYLADQVNANPALQSAGIYAVAGQRQLQIHETQGDDLKVGLTAIDNETLSISDGTNNPVVLEAEGTGSSTQIVVGGRLDVSLAEGVEMGSFPGVSMLFGDTHAEDFAQSSYMGIQATVKGKPEDGDRFTLDFNLDAASDNRNGLNLVNLQAAKTMGGVASFSQGYGKLVEFVGIETHSAKINRDAAEQVLRQTEELRNSISGVNLDEEAADLIRFEQLFSANAQVISVARDTFDRLLSSF